GARQDTPLGCLPRPARRSALRSICCGADGISWISIGRKPARGNGGLATFSTPSGGLFAWNYDSIISLTKCLTALQPFGSLLFVVLKNPANVQAFRRKVGCNL